MSVSQYNDYLTKSNLEGRANERGSMKRERKKKEEADDFRIVGSFVGILK